MGMSCQTGFKFSFIYKMLFENGLTEHEFDHVFFGVSDEEPRLNPLEVKDYRYIGLEKLRKDVESHPQKYSAWLQICLPRVTEYFNKI